MRAVIAEDNVLLRDGLAGILTDHGIDVVASVGEAGPLLDLVARHQPDIAVVDVRMPPTHTDEGLRAALQIRSQHRGTAVLVLSQWVETDYARVLLAAGPDHVGYLLKDRIMSIEDFVQSLNTVAAGGNAIDPEVIRQLLSRPAVDPGLARLTERQYEILGLVAQGLSNPAIGRRLHLAPRSIEKSITAIFGKLDLAPAADEHRRVLAVLRYLGVDPTS